MDDVEVGRPPAVGDQTEAPSRIGDPDRVSSKLRLLLIVGSGRSGSTLLQTMLGRTAGTAGMGESVRVWERAFHNLELCGCGEPLTRCRVWAPVFAACRVTSARDADRLATLRREALSHRGLGARSARALSTAGTEYAGLLRVAFETFAARTGARLLIDGSKQPEYARFLAQAFDDVSFIHVVRDPRGVAFSLRRRVRRPDVTRAVEYMPRYSALRASAFWLRRNAQTELLSARRPKTRIRYEDLTADPAAAIRRVWAGLGEPPDPAGSVRDAGTLHLAGGNPRRFERSDVIEVDDEWRTAASRSALVAVTAFTAPLLVRYGYSLSWTKGPLRDEER